MEEEGICPSSRFLWLPEGLPLPWGWCVEVHGLEERFASLTGAELSLPPTQPVPNLALCQIQGLSGHTSWSPRRGLTGVSRAPMWEAARPKAPNQLKGQEPPCHRHGHGHANPSPSPVSYL